MQRKITFIARHYPPDKNINGESVRDMVKYLEEKHQIKSNIICINRKSAGGALRTEPVGNIIRLNTIYSGNSPVPRFFAFLYDGFILARKALQYKDTLIVCTTSPPMLPFWASLFFKKVNWALWALDLFPEGFKLTGFIKAQNPIYKFALKTTYKNNPDFLIALGPRQALHLEKAYAKKLPATILPCGVFFYQNKSEQQPDWWEEDKIFLGYCGNIGNAHNENFIKAVIDNIDPQKQVLVLALYGIKAPALKKYAQGKAGVILVDSVPRDQLHFIDIHLVSLKKEWTHVAVPSKAISAVFMGSAVLFCGDKESDNWFLLQNASWLIEENDSIDQQVAAFLKSLDSAQIIPKKEATQALVKKLQDYVLQSYDKVAVKAKNIASASQPI